MGPPAVRKIETVHCRPGTLSPRFYTSFPASYHSGTLRSKSYTTNRRCVWLGRIAVSSVLFCLIFRRKVPGLRVCRCTSSLEASRTHGAGAPAARSAMFVLRRAHRPAARGASSRRPRPRRRRAARPASSCPSSTLDGLNAAHSVFATLASRGVVFSAGVVSVDDGTPLWASVPLVAASAAIILLFVFGVSSDVCFRAPRAETRNLALIWRSVWRYCPQKNRPEPQTSP